RPASRKEAAEGVVTVAPVGAKPAREARLHPPPVGRARNRDRPHAVAGELFLDRGRLVLVARVQKEGPAGSRLEQRVQQLRRVDASAADAGEDHARVEADAQVTQASARTTPRTAS